MELRSATRKKRPTAISSPRRRTKPRKVTTTGPKKARARSQAAPTATVTPTPTPTPEPTPTPDPTPPRYSPDWDLDDTEFQPEREQSHSPTPALLSEEEPSSDDEAPNAGSPSSDSRQARNARGAAWLPYQDRLLVEQVEVLRPFDAGRGAALMAAWDSLSVQLASASRIKGKEISKSGNACKARFLKLLKAHRADETRSLQKTGTNEEVDEHVQRLTSINELYHEQELRKTDKSTAAQKKAKVEQDAALEIRDAAMRGLVRRENLTDVAQLDSASVREKQGQRRRKCCQGKP
ncbi:Myb-like domain-containing protein [Mycena indigotica]|uniref:Myb-like domain-containing protein n=1 Tax=Mycena indigotica TaxID=2126181 RepID=A0A8H6T368_9AGAR|nr:Myb-like domain-containing protein [Mycena indigotica]KAF7310148.1 Myb-like domain-containing protein [Mycena indigotica]